MGRDITVLGKHNLDVSSITTLAKDLNTRLQLNIIAQTHVEEYYFKSLQQHEYKNYTCNTAYIINTAKPNYVLFDENEEDKYFVEKFGNPKLYKERFSNLTEKDAIKLSEKKEIDHKIALIKHACFSLEGNFDNDYECMHIYNEIYENSFSYFGRWWSLCKFFTDEEFNTNFANDLFLSFRKSLLKTNTVFKGEEMYYLDDQSDFLEGVGQGNEQTMSWEALKAFVIEKTGHLMVDVPQFLNDESYRKAFLLKNEYPLSFVDDFRDLK